MNQKVAKRIAGAPMRAVSRSTLRVARIFYKESMRYSLSADIITFVDKCCKISF